jgi:hypothetical protein
MSSLGWLRDRRGRAITIRLPSASADAGDRVEANTWVRVGAIRPVAVLLAVVLLLGACDRFGGDGSGTGGSEPAGIPWERSDP